MTISAIKLDKHRTLSITHSSAKYQTNSYKYEDQLDQIVKGQLGENKFITEFNYLTSSFSFKTNIKACTGYEPEEFNVDSLNNQSNARYKITHQDDIMHKQRYDMITFSLVTSEYKFDTLCDYVKMSFRLNHKKGHVINVDRSVYLFRVNDQGNLISQISIWEVSKTPNKYVTPKYYTKHYENIMTDFHKLNSSILGIKYTPTENKILLHKLEYRPNEVIRALLNVSSIRTVEKHIENIIRKTRTFIGNQRLDYSIFSIYEALHVAQLFGLLNYQGKIPTS